MQFQGRQKRKERIREEIFWVMDIEKPQDFRKIFQNPNPLILDIGAGKGEFAVAMAKRLPQYNFICIEKRPPRTQAIASKKLHQNLPNIFILQGRIEHIFPHCFFDQSVAKVYMNFPDPWPKQSYRNRRNLNDQFVAMMHRLLQPGGDFHFATDVVSYAQSALETFERHGGYQNALHPHRWTHECSDEQKTLFYYHAQRDGLQSQFLHFQKV